MTIYQLINQSSFIVSKNSLINCFQIMITIIFSELSINYVLNIYRKAKKINKIKYKIYF